MWITLSAQLSMWMHPSNLHSSFSYSWGKCLTWRDNSSRKWRALNLLRLKYQLRTGVNSEWPRTMNTFWRHSAMNKDKSKVTSRCSWGCSRLMKGQSSIWLMILWPQAQRILLGNSIIQQSPRLHLRQCITQRTVKFWKITVSRYWTKPILFQQLALLKLDSEFLCIWIIF